MAGSGNISPRQRMINMMYLVLLALLALNVSKEILNSFETIKKKLNGSAMLANENANNMRTAMIAEIDDEVKNQGKTSNVGLKDTLAQINSKTSEMIGLIDEHIAKMEEIAGVDPETGSYISKDEMEENYQYWMGPLDDSNGGRGNGKATELHDLLDTYYKELADFERAIVTDELKSQVKVREIPLKQKGLDGSSKSWEIYNFDAPVVANMTFLESLKLDVYEEQNKVMDVLETRLGKMNFVADKVMGFSAPVSSVVPAGVPFETKLFVALTSSQIQPRFASGSGSITKEEGGNVGKLTIPTSGNFKGNEAKRKFSATITVPKATGGFENITVENEYTVRKPGVTITSAAVQNLYRDCANDLNISSPALGNYYNPRVTVTNGSVTPNQSSKEKFRIIPTGRTCDVKVNNVINGSASTIDVIKFNVITPPKPSINMRVDGREVSGPTPMTRASRIEVRLEPDNEFKSQLPQDAKYGITRYTVKAQQGLGSPQTIHSGSISGEASAAKRISLGGRVSSLRPGTNIYIELEGIYRVNFQNKKINIPYNRREMITTLVLRS